MKHDYSEYPSTIRTNKNSFFMFLNQLCIIRPNMPEPTLKNSCQIWSIQLVQVYFQYLGLLRGSASLFRAGTTVELCRSNSSWSAETRSGYLSDRLSNSHGSCLTLNRHKELGPAHVVLLCAPQDTLAVPLILRTSSGLDGIGALVFARARPAALL